jgi:hypothetical protein
MLTSAPSAWRAWRRIHYLRDGQRRDPEHRGLVASVSRRAPHFERQGAADGSERKAREG